PHPYAPPLALPSFPTRRSSDLAPRETRQQRQASWVDSDLLLIDDHRQPRRDRSRLDPTEVEPLAAGGDRQRDFVRFGRRQHKDEDRKSTRLNSSHVAISYAVFC